MREIQLFETDEGQFIAHRREAEPSIAEMGAALAGAGAGNVNNGVHSYLVTFQTADGETTFTPEDLALISVTVDDKTDDGKVALTDIPVGSAFVLARRIWRTKADADPNLDGNYFLVDSIDDNTTTTYTDNTSDANLGGAGHDETVPAENTTLNEIVVPNLPADGDGTTFLNDQGEFATPAGGGASYLVYTALLSQSGDGTSTQTTGPLTVGKRYKITSYVAGDDFLNVGASANATNEEFTATGTTPTVWSNASELTDTAAPVATVLENTVGEVVWDYVSAGNYVAHNVAFNVDKTWAQLASGAPVNDPPTFAYCLLGSGEIQIGVGDSLGNVNNVLSGTAIEIRVYP